MSLSITAVVCTHNPRPDHLGPTLDSLRAQTLPLDRWEFLLVDNASAEPLATDLSWHPNGRVVREDRVGLTFARLRSYHESRAPLLVYIDDDNILEPAYLETVLARFEAEPDLGAAGGRSLPVYEVEPPAWFFDLGIHLGCRDLGDEELEASWVGVPLAERAYPGCAPIGAGLCVRKEAYRAYVEAAAGDPVRTALGRSGQSLASGEDNDIVMSILEAGWRVAYFPELSLQHLIPAGRVAPAYLERIAHGANKTWVLVLGIHGIRPWSPVSAWTLPARKARAFLRMKAWQSLPQRIRWRGACGQYEGRALLHATSELGGDASAQVNLRTATP